MRKTTTIFIVIAATLLLLIGIPIIGGFLWDHADDFTVTPITTFESEDGVYSLSMLQIGSPAWPFGAVKGRFALHKGDTLLLQLDFSVQDDGAGLHHNTPTVTWHADRVTVQVSGSEQKDVLYTLLFDGTHQEQTLDEQTNTSM